jgi:hypothetical protein
MTLDVCPNRHCDENLELFFIYKIFTVLICRRETAVWLQCMKPDTNFSVASAVPFCSNKRYSDKQTCSPHTLDYALNFLAG